MAYTSLFKKDDVRITTPFSSTHKGIDLSRGVVEQPIYLPNRAVSGTVWKILSKYTSGGVYYKDAPIIYIKHKDGSGSRYIHSHPKDVKVKVGDTVVAGQQICCTGNSGHSHGDHLHFEWLTKWDDLNTRVDPTSYVMNDNKATFKVGDKIIFTGVQNIRKGAGDKFNDIGDTKTGQIATIKDGPRTSQNKQLGKGENDDYIWWDMDFGGGSGWVADVGKFELYKEPETPPAEAPVSPPDCEEHIKRIEILEAENRGLNETLAKSENNAKLSKEREVYLEGVIEEYKASEGSLMERIEYLEQENGRLEKEKGELEYELSQLKNNKQFFDKIVEWLNKLLKKILGK